MNTNPSGQPYYAAHGNEVSLYEAAYSARLPVMLKGPTGCGKSRFVEYMALSLIHISEPTRPY